MNEANLVPSLLQAIVNIDGDALVMHAGDKPYVVAAAGQVELASRGLTLEAVNGIVMQLLPVEFQQALDEFGAIQYALSVKDQFPNERFTVVVARGGDDVWAEIRRRRVPDDDLVPMELFAPPMAGQEASYSSPLAARQSYEGDVLEADKPISPFVGPTVLKYDSAPSESSYAWPRAAERASETNRTDNREKQTVEAPEAIAAPAAPALPTEVVAPAPAAPASPIEFVEPTPDIVVPVLSQPVVLPAPAAQLDAPSRESQSAPAAPQLGARDAELPIEERLAVAAEVAAPTATAELPETVEPVVPGPHVAETASVDSPAPSALKPAAPEPSVIADTPTLPIAAHAAERSAPSLAAGPKSEDPVARPVQSPGVVLPMTRGPLRFEPPPAVDRGDTFAGLERLLRTAAARGASTLYLSSDARPSVRVDGELQNLDTEPVHTTADVISLLLSLMPDRSHEALRTGATTEWICDIEDIGRVRCMSFSDYRGPGGVFRLMPVRSISADQLGLSREVQSLALEPEGLVLITGSRSSGKRALISSLVDLVNRNRRAHVITIEREVNIVHTRGSSFISQREVRGTDDDVLAAARAALREDPDVLVLEQIRTGLLMNVALEAAASGHLVIGGFSAHNAADAIDRMLDLYAPEHARHVQLALADNLRGVVAQVLLPKVGGGRVAAREILLNTPAVASVIAEGKTSQLPMAIEGGRRVGMVPLSDALVGYVQSGIVDIRDAYRHVSDRPAFIALLKRQGIDTSAIERLA